VANGVDVLFCCHHDIETFICLPSRSVNVLFAHQMTHNNLPIDQHQRRPFAVLVLNEGMTMLVRGNVTTDTPYKSIMMPHTHTAAAVTTTFVNLSFGKSRRERKKSAKTNSF